MDSAQNCMGDIGESWKACAHNYEQYSFWDSAPDELIARILTFLPCSNIYLAQEVCRKWRSVIWSPLFMVLFKERFHRRRPWLLEFQQQMYNQAWAFDLDGWQWFHLNFSFLPENAIILASSGGLVCLGRSSKEEYHLYICNPLTKQWRQLPSLPVHPGVVLLDVDHQNNAYTVAALVFRGHGCASRPFGSVSVFDSKTGNWKETIGVPQELHFRQIWDASLCGTSLCCLTKQSRAEMFDITEENWTQNGRFSHLPPGIAMYPYIFKKEGKWGVFLPTQDTDAMSVMWYDVGATCWNSALPANAIMCSGRYSSLCCDSALSDGLEVYTASVEGHKGDCAGSGWNILLPKSPLTRQKMRGREIVIGAVWYEPHPGAMI